MQNHKELERAKIIVERVEQAGKDLTADYNQWMNIAFSLASLGEDGRALFLRVSALNPKYDAKECDEKYSNVMRTKEGRMTLGTFCDIAKKNGIDISLPLGRPRQSKEEEKEEKPNNMNRALMFLNEHLELRHNIWNNRIEQKKGDGTWVNIGDREADIIYSDIKLSGINISKTDMYSLFQKIAPDYDEINEWLKGLDKWVPSESDDFENEIFADDAILQFFSAIQVNDTQNEVFYLHFMRKWLVGLVGMMTGRIDEHNLMLVLTGPQHLGKTFFIRNILPPLLRKYMYEANPSARVDKDFIISLSEFPLIFLDEFTIGSDSKSNAYKYIISSNKSNERDAYAHFRESRKRRAALIGATNEKRYIKDREGNRRYLSVDVAGTRNLIEHPLNYERAYAMALYLLEHGYETKPSNEESTYLSQHNEDFVEPNDVEEVIKTMFNLPTDREKAKAYSAADISKKLRQHYFSGEKYNVFAIGKAMHRLKFPSSTVNGTTKYAVAEIDSSRESEMKAEAQDILDKNK